MRDKHPLDVQTVAAVKLVDETAGILGPGELFDSIEEAIAPFVNGYLAQLRVPAGDRESDGVGVDLPGNLEKEEAGIRDESHALLAGLAVQAHSSAGAHVVLANHNAWDVEKLCRSRCRSCGGSRTLSNALRHADAMCPHEHA